jgi:dolichol-phosphate mannosyltransferase
LEAPTGLAICKCRQAKSFGDRASDTGCSLKVIRREHVRFSTPFNGLHRYLPALFERAGLSFSEIPVGHRPRKTGVSKYTINGRALRGLVDLVGVRWIMDRMIIWPSEIKNEFLNLTARSVYCDF